MACQIAAQRVYPAFRLYARDLNDVEPLRRYFAERGLLVSTQAQTIAQVQSLSRSTGALLLFVVLQALYSGVLAAVLSAVLYRVAEEGLNHLFVQSRGEYASQLLLGHYVLALFSVLVVCALAAALGGWRVARIEASEGIRDV